MPESDRHSFDVFQSKCLRRILKVQWKDHVSTEELLKRAEMEPLSREVMRRRWKMIGHILRKDRNSNEMIALTWAPEGRRRRGRPKTTWRRTVERERNEGGWKSWEEARAGAANRERWNMLD